MVLLLRRLLVVATALGALGALAITAARLSGSTTWVATLLVTFTPYALVPYLLLVVVAAYAWVRGPHGPRARRPRRGWSALLVAVGLLGLVVHLTWWLPQLEPSAARRGDDGAGVAVRVLSVNVLKGRADPDDLARVISEVDPDVLVLLEVEPPLLFDLEAVVPPDLTRVAGSGSRLDTQVFSSFASPGSQELGLTLGAWRTELAVGDQVVQTFAAHPFNPALRPAAWRFDHQRLREAVLATSGPALVVGDLNAVLDHPPLRRLAEADVLDAADLAGVGWQPTFPVGVPFPPLIAIDHVLVRGDWVVRDVRTHRVADTDHLGISADLVLRGAAPGG